MRTTLLAFALGLTCLGLLPAWAAPGPAGSPAATPRPGAGVHPRPIQARLWVEDDRDYFRRGDRLRVRFTTSEDAHIAILHVDPDGNLDFLFPSDPWEDDFVRGGRVHSLDRGFHRGWTVRSGSGIGYLFLIASPIPLDYSYFRSRGGGSWDWSYGGRLVRGDPFWAFEQITRLLVPDWRYTHHAVDYYGYHVGGRHRYPTYACSTRYYESMRGWGWSSTTYRSCDGLELFLREHPHYYDTRLYRGDRRAYLRRIDAGEPEHHYKESGDRASRRAEDPFRYREPEPAPPTRASPETVRQARPLAPGTRESPARRRPTLERRPTVREPGGARPATPREPVRAAPRARRPAGREGGTPPAGASTREPRRESAEPGSPRGGASPRRRPPGGGGGD